MHIDVIAELLVAIFLIGIVLFVVDKYNKDELADWAGRNGLTLVKVNWSLFRPMSLWPTTSQNLIVYRITVRDHAGRTRSGWARRGNWLYGMWPNGVDVFWDDAEVHWN